VFTATTEALAELVVPVAWVVEVAAAVSLDPEAEPFRGRFSKMPPPTPIAREATIV
jgi:hypothetical protein